MRIGILGPLEVWDEAARPVRVGGPRARALLIRLAIDAGRVVTAEALVHDLWAGGPPAAAGNALQALVYRLRCAVGHDLIESHPAGYRLAVEPGDVDAGEFEQHVTAARAALGELDAAGVAALLGQALNLWRGPPLADVADASFASAPVARLERLRIAAIEDRVDADFRLGSPARLVAELEDLANAYPLRERLIAQLMRALHAAGRQADALTVYEKTRQALAERLGADPSAELSAVHLAILRRDPALDNAARPEPPLSAAQTVRRQRPTPIPEGGQGPAETPDVPSRRTNLPAQFTSFVGREEEIERVNQLFDQARLVTLTGPGGAGKTRLGCEVAASFVPQLPDGVWFVPLGHVSDAPGVSRAVLAAMRVPEGVQALDAKEARSPLTRLADALVNARLMLILDNCEHLIDTVAHLADRLLAAAPGLRVLATSREPLGLTGEMLCPVPSLSLPPPEASPLEAAGYASVRLFADRAAAIRPAFRVDDSSVAPVIRICRALDGIPLAIELAAARLNALTPVQVADRLDDRFRLLTVGSRTAVARHQTLRAAVDWSWDLLDEAERAALRRLSVFRGGAALQAAESVCALAGDSRDFLDVISSLVSKSLVMAVGDAEARYHLLETVRAYAAERLANAGERDRVRAVHTAYFLSFAQRADPGLRGHHQVRWAQLMTGEQENCAAALEFAVGARDLSTALNLVAALAWFCILSGHAEQAGRWAAAVLDVTGSAPPGLENEYAICVIMAAFAAGTPNGENPGTAVLQAALRRAISLVGDASSHPVLAIGVPIAAALVHEKESTRRGLHAATGHPDPWVRAAAHAFNGYLALNDANIAAAAVDLTQGLTGFREVGDRLGMIICLGGLGDVAMARGKPDEAVRAFEEACSYAAAQVSPGQGVMIRIKLGQARAGLGDIAGARADLEAGLRNAQQMGEHDEEASAYISLGELARRDGDLRQARSLLEQARDVLEPRAEQAGLGQARARTYSKLGCVAEQEGDLAGAAHWHAKAVRVATDGDFLPGGPTLASVIEGLAALAVARDRPADAAELLGAAHTLHGFADSASLDVVRTMDAATVAIGYQDFDSAYQRGRLLTRAETLDLACRS